ncbi:MAG: preprotein translocase subunit YajC [Tidjanibacter sp.]|nr:preprotein translocase subunit YajC [Tidjanibacter sp.]
MITTIMLQAAGAVPQQGSPMSGIIMMVLLFAVMFIFMILPQRKQQKEMEKFRNSITKGQKVITAGGIYGVVKEVNERDILLEVDGNVTLRVDKAMIMRDPRQ